MWYLLSAGLLLPAAPPPPAGADPCDAYLLGAPPSSGSPPALSSCLSRLRQDVEWVRGDVLRQRKASEKETAEAQKAMAAASVAEIEAAAKKIGASLEPIRKALSPNPTAFADAVEKASREIRTSLIEIEAQLAKPASPAPQASSEVDCTPAWSWRIDRTSQRCVEGKRVFDAGAFAASAHAAQLRLRSVDDAKGALRAQRDLEDAVRSLMTTLGLRLPTNEECAPYVLKSGYRRAPERGDLGIVTGCVQRLQGDIDWARGQFESGLSEVKSKAQRDARIKNALARIQKALAVAEDAAKDAARQDEVKEAVASIQKAATDIAAVLSPQEPDKKKDAANDAARPCSDAWLYFDRGIQGCDDKDERVLLNGTSLAEYVNRAHFTLGRLDSWARRLAEEEEKKKTERTDGKEIAPPAPRVDPRRAVVDDAKKTIHALMGRMDLRRPFSGVFVPALGFVTTGAQPAPAPTPTPAPSPASAAPGATGNPQGETTATEAEAATLGYVAWESKHLGFHEGGTFDVSLAGKFGFQRVFDMARPEGAPETAAPAATFQGAFVWDAGARFNVTLPGRFGELGLLGRAGQTRLNSDFALVKLKPEAGKQALVAPLATASGRTKWYYETGARITIFGDKFELAHEQNVLDPMFFVAFGLRRDDRLRGRSDLNGYEAPQDRWFLQLALNRLPVIKGNETFKVTFAVEHEWARHRNSLTSGTKLLVQGHLDLLSAFGSKGE